jgi:hypothetical protein
MLTQGFQPVHLQPSCLNWDQATLPTHFKVTFSLNKLRGVSKIKLKTNKKELLQLEGYRYR